MRLLAGAVKRAGECLSCSFDQLAVAFHYCFPSRCAAEAVQDVRSRRDAIAAKLAAANALLAEAAALGWDFAPPIGPKDLSFSQARQLQAWVGGSGNPHAWAEVYRGSRDGFTAAAFHRLCDGKARLLVLVKDKEGGWLFGGFTALGYIKGADRQYADPAAFLFSLTNPAGRPERLASKGDGKGVVYSSSCLAVLGGGADLAIYNGCASNKSSFTFPGRSYAAPSVAGGSHPMAQGKRVYFTVAELVAWTVPQ